MEARYKKEDIKNQINLGSPVCEKIKQIYYANEPWIDCYKKVSGKFTQLKDIAKNFYTDKDDKQILMELVKYTNDDIKDCFT